MALGLAAAEVGEASVTIRLEAVPAPRLLALTDGVRPGRAEGPAVAVARRVAQAAGTSLELHPEGGGIALSAAIPVRAEPAPEAQRA
jgi:hypothetical protein